MGAAFPANAGASARPQERGAAAGRIGLDQSQVQTSCKCLGATAAVLFLEEVTMRVFSVVVSSIAFGAMAVPTFAANKGIPCEASINASLRAVEQPALNEGKYKFRHKNALYSYGGFTSSEVNLRQWENSYQRQQDLTKELAAVEKDTVPNIEAHYKDVAAFGALEIQCLDCSPADQGEIRRIRALIHNSRQGEDPKIADLNKQIQEIQRSRGKIDLQICEERTCSFDDKKNAALHAQRKVANLSKEVVGLKEALAALPLVARENPALAKKLERQLTATLDQTISEIESQRTIIKEAPLNEPSTAYRYSRIEFDKGKIYLYLGPGLLKVVSNPMPVVIDMATCKSDHSWFSRCKESSKATPADRELCKAEQAAEKANQDLRRVERELDRSRPQSSESAPVK